MPHCYAQYFYLPVNFLASEGMTVGHSKSFTAENSAKRGDGMVPIFLFTAKFSAKRGDDSRSQ